MIATEPQTARPASGPSGCTGWGADEAAIAKMRASKDRSARKDFGL